MMQKAGAPYLISVMDDDTEGCNSLGNLLQSVGLIIESFASAEEFLASSRADSRSGLILGDELLQLNWH
jgi:FixJ family two-component response regulator